MGAAAEHGADTPSRKWENVSLRPSLRRFSASSPGNTAGGSLPSEALGMRATATYHLGHGPGRCAGTPDITLPHIRGGAIDMGRVPLVSSSQGFDAEGDTPAPGPPMSGLEPAPHRLGPLRNLFNRIGLHRSSREEKSASEGARPASSARRPELSRLVMPAARKSGLVLNEASPPVSPVVSPEEDPFAQAAPPRTASPRIRSPYVPPRHAWSAAQAAADAAAAVPGAKEPVDVPYSSAAAELPPLPAGVQPSPPPSLASASSLAWSSSSSSSHTEHALQTRPSRTWFWEMFARKLPARVRRSTQEVLSSPSKTRAHSTPRLAGASFAPHMFKLALLGLTFVVATLVLGALLSTLPLRLPAHLADLTLTEIRDMCAELQRYSRSSSSAMMHVFFVLSTLFTWKQTFCVPGSLIMNIVYGAMYGAYAGSVYASLLTALGGVLCYLISAPFSELVGVVPGLAKPLGSMRAALARASTAPKEDEDNGTERQPGGKKNIWSYLMVLRLLPIVPYGAMNIACGVLGVPLLPYAVTLGVGSIPWNFVTTQVGEILQDIVSALQLGATRAYEAASTDAEAAHTTSAMASSRSGTLLSSGALTVLMERVWTLDMIIKLTLLSFASLLPLLLNRWLRAYRDDSAAAEEACADGLGPALPERDARGSFDARPESPVQHGKARVHRLSAVMLDS